jgi:hypothetical protein
MAGAERKPAIGVDVTLSLHMHDTLTHLHASQRLTSAARSLSKALCAASATSLSESSCEAPLHTTDHTTSNNSRCRTTRALTSAAKALVKGMCAFLPTSPKQTPQATHTTQKSIPHQCSQVLV